MSGVRSETSIRLRRAKAGDRESLDWIVERLSPLLLAQARYRLTDSLRRHVDPADLVQEVWAVALPRLGGLDAREGRETPVLVRFLATTLLHQVNNLARRVARREANQPPAPARGPGVTTHVARAEARARVHEAIEALDERGREIVVLRGIEQQPVDVIAQLLGLSQDAVRQRWSRALKQLRARLPESVFDELS